ncbi:MAG: argininosuccinate lyase [Actinobacteria bacterium]|nr:argininosuccinate lyase [Actinomycetota bacterium]
MVAAGYELEVADGPVLHHGLTLADLAHVLELADQGVVGDADRRELLGALLELAHMPAGDFPFDPVYGDAYNSRERWLQPRVGRAAGWLAAGRPRREAGRIAFRIALRGRVVALAAAVARLGGALTEGADRHAGALMADYTYLQAAQATTFGHYLLSFTYPTLRDGRRLREAHAWVNRSPGGAGGVAGSRLPVDRARVAALLGFDGHIEHTRDAMWQTDGLVALLTAASLAVVNASRLAEDLEIYASDEFGLVGIGDAFCRASVLMPQKRNPYALSVIRGGAGTLTGRVAGLLATQRTPSARTDNLLYAYGEVTGAVDMATRLVDLAAAVTESLEPDTARMARAAGRGFTQATDLAEALCQATGRDYRSCYLVVSRAVALATERGLGPEALDAGAIERAARQVLGEALSVPDDVVAGALDPRVALETRTVPGGAAAEPMAAMVRECRQGVADLRSWAEDRRRAAGAAEEALLAEARARRG